MAEAQKPHLTKVEAMLDKMVANPLRMKSTDTVTIIVLSAYCDGYAACGSHLLSWLVEKEYGEVAQALAAEFGLSESPL